MNDKKLRREAMLKEYDLSNLLKHAANTEDVERQAANMEKAATEQVNRVDEQRKSNSKHRKKYKPPPKQEMKLPRRPAHSAVVTMTAREQNAQHPVRRAAIAIKRVISLWCADIRIENVPTM